MQNKGFVIFIVAVLSLVCAYYISFSPVVSHYDKKAQQLTAQGKDGQAYLDSMANEKVWFGYTLKEARKQQIGLGLDLKGGMNVVLRLDGTELLKNLSGRSDDPNFLKALENTRETADSRFIDRFVSEYKQLNPNGQLAALFGAGPLREEINRNTTDDQVVKILKDRYDSAIEASLKVLRTRIDRFGVVSPNLQRIEGQDRIMAELPGVTEPERVRELLSASANLEFWRTYTLQEVAEDLQNADIKLQAYAQGAPTQPEQETAPAPAADSAQTTAAPEQAAAPADSAAQPAPANPSADTAAQTAAPQASAPQAEQKSLLSLLSLNGGRGGAVVGTAHSAARNDIDSMINLAREKGFIREDLYLMWGSAPMKDPQTRRETDLYELYAIKGNRAGTADLTGDVVTGAKSEVRNDIGQNMPVVSMTMNEDGAARWARLTKENINKSIAIVLDGVVYSAPVVRNEITGGSSEISGDFTLTETTDLANVLSSGKMETSISIEHENVVGPSLGQESIQKGIISFIIAIILLALYMCLAYGLIPGLIADGAFVFNAFFTIGVMASFHSVLTLSGIAGLVLTLGMAVDANVLIFERIKEELRAGKTVSRAIKEGYQNAFSAILDSNVTTVITGFVLFYFGTGPIKGFATTLIIGVIASFITAVFMTRLVMEALDRKHKLDKITYTTRLTKNLLVNPKVNFLGKRKAGLLIPSALIVAGIVAIFTIGLKEGIEFSGGRNYEITFDQPVSVENVRASVSAPLNNQVVVTAIGTEGTAVRISTNYKIEDTSEAAEQDVMTKMFGGLKHFYKANVDQEQFVNTYIISSQRVSPSMSADIRNQAIIAVLISMIFMGVYILIRFRNIAFSLGAFASVAATTFCIIALYALLWKIMPFAMEIDQNFIAALLAIIGYSINDVVVVFDRVREYNKLYPMRDEFTVMNEALNSTLSRTVNTTGTTFIVMLVVFVLGGASMRSFTFALLLGILIGVYSTLFVASPIAYMIRHAQSKKRARVAPKKA